MTSADRHSLAVDLETVRDVVARTVESSAAFARLEDELVVTRRRVSELEEQLAVASAPVTVDRSDLGSLSDAEVLKLVAGLLRSTVQTLSRARYDGDVRSVWTLISLMRPTERDPVRIRAARALLGQESS